MMFYILLLQQFSLHFVNLLASECTKIVLFTEILEIYIYIFIIYLQCFFCMLLHHIIGNLARKHIN